LRGGAPWRDVPEKYRNLLFIASARYWIKFVHAA
jgi:hypothetical protein